MEKKTFSSDFVKNSNVKFTLILLMLIILTALINTGCTAKSEQRNPAIFENIVVWQDNRNGQWDIYGYDLDIKKEFRITNGKGDSITPAIQGDIVVWANTINNLSEIYGYNLKTKETFQVSDDKHEKDSPAVYGNIVVWRELKDDAKNIRAINIFTKESFKINEGQTRCFSPSMYGNYIIWANWIGSGGHSEVYAYDLRNGKNLLLYDKGYNSDTCIFENIAAWSGGNIYIRLYDIGTSNKGGAFFEIDSRGAVISLKTYKKTIVWSGGGYIKIYNMGSTIELLKIKEEDIPGNISIHENIVVWEDAKDIDWDIYGYNLDTKEEFPICTK